VADPSPANPVAVQARLQPCAQDVSCWTRANRRSREGLLAHSNAIRFHLHLGLHGLWSAGDRLSDPLQATSATTCRSTATLEWRWVIIRLRSLGGGGPGRPARRCSHLPAYGVGRGSCPGVAGHNCRRDEQPPAVWSQPDSGESCRASSHDGDAPPADADPAEIF